MKFGYKKEVAEVGDNYSRARIHRRNRVALLKADKHDDPAAGEHDDFEMEPEQDLCDIFKS